MRRPHVQSFLWVAMCFLYPLLSIVCGHWVYIWSRPVFVFYFWQNGHTQLTDKSPGSSDAALTWSPHHLGSFTPFSELISSFIRSVASRHHLSLSHPSSTGVSAEMSLIISLFFFRFTHTRALRQGESGVTTSLVPRAAWVKHHTHTHANKLQSLHRIAPRFLVHTWVFMSTFLLLPHQPCCGHLLITAQCVRTHAHLCVLVHVCLCVRHFQVSALFKWYARCQFELVCRGAPYTHTLRVYV